MTEVASLNHEIFGSAPAQSEIPADHSRLCRCGELELEDRYEAQMPTLVPAPSVMRAFREQLGVGVDRGPSLTSFARGFYDLNSSAALHRSVKVSMAGRTDLWYAQAALTEPQVRQTQLTIGPVDGKLWNYS